MTLLQELETKLKQLRTLYSAKLDDLENVNAGELEELQEKIKKLESEKEILPKQN